MFQFLTWLIVHIILDFKCLRTYTKGNFFLVIWKIIHSIIKNPKTSSILMLNNYSPKAKWILSNNLRDEVEGIIRQYSLSLREDEVEGIIRQYSLSLREIIVAGSRRARNLVCTPYLDFGGNLFCQNRSINLRKPIRSHFHSNKIF